MRIPSDTWKIIEMKIRRYPDQKREYDEYLSIIMSASDGSSIILSSEDKPQSVTEAKALKMTSAYFEQMKKEIIAIEFAYNSLNDEEQMVMKKRFWTDRKRSIPYLDMDVNYSERQCKRIVFKIITLTGRALGEIK